MAKKLTLGFVDATLDAIATSTAFHVCSGEPAAVGDIAAASLGTGVVDGADFVKSGAVGSRVLTVGAQSFSATASGTPTHYVLTDGADMFVTTMTADAVVSGTDYNVDAVTITPAVA